MSVSTVWTRTGRTVLLGVLAIAAIGFLHPASANAATVSVRDFGAAGNGVTNDSEAVRAALKSGSAPRVVVFPAGDYVFSRVYIPSDTTVRFEPAARALAPIGSQATDFFFAVLGTATLPAANVRLEGGEFLGRPTIGGVVLATYARNLTVDGIRANSVLRPVATAKSSYVTVEDSAVRNGRAGFSFELSDHVSVSRCDVREMRRDGIVFFGRSRYVVANDNYVSGYMRENIDGIGGIHLYGSTNATFTGNVIVDGGYNSAGIRIRDGEVFWVEGNYVDSPGSSGYQVHRVGDYAGLDGGNGTFINNTVVNAKLRGFDVANPRSKPVRIIGNTVRNVTSSSPVSAGMGIVTMPSGCVVVGNTVEACTGAGIQVGGSRSLVGWNTVRNVARINFGARVGVFVLGTGHGVVANVIQDSLSHMINGIRLYTGGSALIRGNSISGSTGSAYDLRGTRLSSLFSDRTAPLISYRVSESSVETFLVNFEASDASGIVAVRYSLNSAPYRITARVRDSLAVPAASVNSLRVQVLDRAGNISTKTIYTGLTPTKMELDSYAPTSTSDYGAIATFAGRLTTVESSPVAGATVALERWDGGRWVAFGSRVLTGADGEWAASGSLTVGGRYRARYASDMSTYDVSTSSEATFQVRARLATPQGPSTMTAGKVHTFYGYLQPRHQAGGHHVRLRYFRYESGTWVLRKTVSSTSSNVSGGSKYVAKVALARGRWKVDAYHADAGHALTRSGSRLLSVR